MGNFGRIVSSIINNVAILAAFFGLLMIPQPVVRGNALNL